MLRIDPAALGAEKAPAPPSQSGLLRSREWNALILLDACRADYLCRVRPEAQPVRSLYSITWGWVARFAEIAARFDNPVLYFTANPVVNREMRKHPQSPFRLISLWDDHWGHHGPLNLPAVHPEAVLEAVESFINRHGQPARMVVHFLQPHVPFIGRPALPYSNWGRGMDDDLSKEVDKLPGLKEALAAGKTSIEAIRDCYRANLEVALPYRDELSRILKGLVVTTSDHGQLLGERGLYGHTAGPIHPELMEVPWLEEQRGSICPAELPADMGWTRAQTQEEAMKSKLRALGYA